jgi:hypothetical protein
MGYCRWKLSSGNLSRRNIVAQVSTFDTIIAIENIAINQNIEISPNPNWGKGGIL